MTTYLSATEGSTDLSNTSLGTGHTSAMTPSVNASSTVTRDDLAKLIKKTDSLISQVEELHPKPNYTQLYISYVVVSILTVYLLYYFIIIMAAPSLTGTWVDAAGKSYIITSSGKQLTVDSVAGVITDGYILLDNGETGVYSDNKIAWTRGVQFTKL